MIDVKRLIAGFLVLASAASFSALILSSLAPNQQNSPGREPAKTADTPPAQIPANAFVRTDYQNNAGLATAQPENPPPTADSLSQENRPSDNLTLNFTAAFSSQILAHNPGGPQSDESGNPTLNLPADSVVDQMISAAIANTNLSLTAGLLPENIHITSAHSDEDIANYIAAANDILTKASDGTKFDTGGSDAVDPQFTSGMTAALGDAIRNISILPVPQPLIDLHKNLLSLLADQKKSFEAITANYAADPLRALVALKSGSRSLDKDFGNLQAQVKILESTQTTSFGKSPAWLSFINSLFGVEKAYAVFPVSVVHDNSILSFSRLAALIKANVESLAHWIYTGLVRMLVNQLINQFQNQVVNWIQGNGSPKFITNWQGFLSDSFNQAAGAAIEKVIPGVCSSFGPLIKLNLKSQYANNNLINGCRLEQIVSNVNNFYNDFSNGGWAAYSESILPSGNYYGSLFATAQEVDAEAQKAKEAAAARAQAGSGFNGQETCSDGSDPHGPHYVCMDEDGVTEHVVSSGSADCSTYGLPAGPPAAVPNGGKCTNNQKPQTTTPGAAVGHALFGSLDWKAHQIVSAQRLEELATALIDASINRIIKTGLTAVNAAINGSDEKINAAGGAPIVGTASGGLIAGASGGDITSTKSNLTELAQSYKDQYQQTVNSYNAWLGLRPQVANTLSQVSMACPTLAGEASLRLNELGGLSPIVQTGLANAQSSLARINDIIDQIANAPDAATLDTLNTTLTSEFDISAATDDAGVAGGRVGNLQALGDNAQANLPSACSTPLDPQQT